MSTPKTISLRKSFRNIRVVVALLLVFVTIQGVVLWRVCQRGTASIQSLEKEGLPSLQQVAILQENLALFRLHSYEGLFAQEAEKPAKAKQAEERRDRSNAAIAELKKLFPEGEAAGQILATEKAFAEASNAFAKARALMDSDFAAAMKALDQELPAKIQALTDATASLKSTCYAFSTESAKHAVSSFGTIRQNVITLGPATAVVALIASALVTVLAWRTRRTMRDISDRLSSGSDDILHAAENMSGTSHKLAESGASQAASVEETSASMEEIRSMVQRNSDNATSAKALANEARGAAEGGAKEMVELSHAMDEIKASSDNIAKILKSIDEIAFQTNILALNAAVEAARAGEAGLGFAVVADEVRSLAHRAGQAARETANSIEESLRRSARGVDISKRVAVGLEQIVEKARQVDELVGEIAVASSEQSRGITQVNGAMTEIDRASQAIAAEADHSAQSSQQLDQQAKDLRTAVAELISFVDDTQKAVRAAATAVPNRPHHAETKAPAVKTVASKPSAKAESNDDFFAPAPRSAAPATKTTVTSGNSKTEGFADFDF